MSQQLALTVAEACEASRVGRNALYQAINGGELRVVKLGRRIVIPVPALQEWLDNRSRRGMSLPVERVG